ncbi:MAG: PilZ domain-containing protein [Terriglobales bacterium]
MNGARTSPSRAQRRSARLSLRVRLMIRLGNEPQMDAETTMISRYGAKLRIGPYHPKLVSGDPVSICMRGSYIWRRARIAWIDRASNSYYGIELESPENFWAVHFPEQASSCDEAAGPKMRNESSTRVRRSMPSYVTAPVPVTPSLVS